MNAILNITNLQIPLIWNDAKCNRIYIEEIFKEIEKTDIVVLPETFTTGFAVKNFHPEKMDGISVQWLKECAQKYDFAISGSLLVEEAGQFYNRMLFVSPNGEIQQYDKWHLFTMGGEGKLISKGVKLPIFNYKGWKMKPLICYDLRFPVSIRNTEDYDLIICIANWPKARVDAWDTLLKARAIENLCYVVGVNRVGVDANGLEYIGHSNIYDPIGKSLHKVTEIEQVQTTAIEKLRIETTRKTFPFLRDMDFFKIKN